MPSTSLDTWLGLSQTLSLREADGTRYTFVCNQRYPGQLAEFVRCPNN